MANTTKYPTNPVSRYTPKDVVALTNKVTSSKFSLI